MEGRGQRKIKDEGRESRKIKDKGRQYRKKKDESGGRRKGQKTQKKWEKVSKAEDREMTRKNAKEK